MASNGKEEGNWMPFNVVNIWSKNAKRFHIFPFFLILWIFFFLFLFWKMIKNYFIKSKFVFLLLAFQINLIFFFIACLFIFFFKISSFLKIKIFPTNMSNELQFVMIVLEIEKRWFQVDVFLLWILQHAHRKQKQTQFNQKEAIN